jgi:WD40 repeat protein
MAVTAGPSAFITMGDLLNNVTYQVNSGANPTYITFDPIDNDIYFLISNSLYTVKLPTSFPATVSALPTPLASALTSISLSADGEYIAAISTGFNLMLYDSTGTLVRTLTSGGNVYASCFESRPR